MQAHWRYISLILFPAVPLPQQLLDLRSFPDRSLLRRYASIWTTDNYARKAWRMVLRHHKPDAVFFLGDLLDSGVEVTDRDEWVALCDVWQVFATETDEESLPPIAQTLALCT